MKTTGVRLYGANDLRVESFELPEIGPGECLMRVVSDTLCASTYKAVVQGPAHKRVPKDVAEHPVLVGHEMCGELVKVGEALRNRWQEGQRVVIQPALKLENGHDPGYSYPHIGGNATYAMVPEIVLKRGCLLPFEGDAFYKGSLVEPVGCVLRAYKEMYHTDYETYRHTFGVKEGGNCVILGGAGPMGIAAAELAFSYGKCKNIVVTDINEERLQEAKQAVSQERAKESGATLHFVSVRDLADPVEALRQLVGGGFDDAFVMTPVAALLRQAEALLCTDGCLNFFAGPADHTLLGSLNLYRVHYDGIHLLGSAGSIPEDTKEVIRLLENGTLDPSGMISHIMGLKAVPEQLMAMKHPVGLKKVCYNTLDLPCVALADLPRMAETDPLYKGLWERVEACGGRWSPEAEHYLLENAPRLSE